MNVGKPGQHLFNDMRVYCSFLTDDVVDWKMTGPNELIVSLNDGSRVRYDAITHRYTTLGKHVASEDDGEFMTEEECRYEFGRRLRQCMRERAMSQTTLSELTDISQVMMSKYINGRALPGYYNISKIARALRCPVSELMVWE